MIRHCFTGFSLVLATFVFAPGGEVTSRLGDSIGGRQVLTPLPALPWCTVNSGSHTTHPCSDFPGTSHCTGFASLTYTWAWLGAENAIVNPHVPSGCPTVGCDGPPGETIDSSASGACRWNL